MKLALGTVQFGLDYGIANDSGRVGTEEAALILKKARLAGIDTLDTAIAYGDSELVLGGLGIESWKVISKVPPLPEKCSDVYEWISSQVLSSLERLGVGKLYGLLLHRPKDLLGDKGVLLYAAIDKLRADGFVEKVGVSVYGSAELDLLLGRYDFDLVQAPLNILDRGLVETGWAARLKSKGVEVHARSVFLQGLLLMPPHQRPKKFNRWKDVWHEWDRWLAETGLSPLQACLRYVNSLDCVDHLIVGVDSACQLHEILEAVTGELLDLPLFGPLKDSKLINPADWNAL